MELPHIGEHCSQPDCNQLDYLPVKCNLCTKIFCNLHHKYEAHSCPERYKLDVRVPICPLCEKPVPNKPGQTPDLAVNEHLENSCKSKSKKIYTNKCSHPGCKQKEMMAVNCGTCSLSFCLRHRHASDHNCKEEVAAKRERTLNGAIFKKNWFGSSGSTGFRSTEQTKTSRLPNAQPKPPRPNVVAIQAPPQPMRAAAISSLQGGLSEQEALERAILASTGRNGTPSVQLPTVSSTAEDEDLARAIAASLEDSGTRSTGRNRKYTADCILS